MNQKDMFEKHFSDTELPIKIGVYQEFCQALTIMLTVVDSYTMKLALYDEHAMATESLTIRQDIADFQALINHRLSAMVGEYTRSG